MFDYRSDKTGFFVTIILLVLLAAAILTTIGMAVSGVAGDTFWFVFKWVWGTWWVLCIVTVLTRLVIFRWQMMRAPRRSSQPERPQDTEPSPQS